MKINAAQRIVASTQVKASSSNDALSMLKIIKGPEATLAVGERDEDLLVGQIKHRGEVALSLNQRSVAKLNELFKKYPNGALRLEAAGQGLMYFEWGNDE